MSEPIHSHPCYLRVNCISIHSQRNYTERNTRSMSSDGRIIILDARQNKEHWEDKYLRTLLYLY